MTPEREMYLAKCSKREQQIRMLIKYYKYELKKAKAVCSSYDLKKIGRKPFGYRLHIGMVEQDKVIISSLYHELARLKGMDRVAPIILETTRSEDTFEIIDADAFCGCCKQLLSIFQKKSYCPNCGRKILWEKVKK